MTAAAPVKVTRDTSLLVATPLYDGAQVDYLRGVIGLVGAAERRKLACTFAWVSNNAAIDRARNQLVGVFLKSGCSHLLFLDGDIGFDPDQVLDLVELMRREPELAVVGAPYPKRRVNWNLVATAAKKGMGDANPAELERYSGMFALEPLDPSAPFRIDQPLELLRLGTGLMMIRREVITALCERHRELRYLPDPQDRLDGNVPDELFGLFQPTIDRDSNLHLSDDYAFCKRVRDAGFRIWAAPWMRTSHTGPARFAGSLADLARLTDPAA